MSLLQMFVFFVIGYILGYRMGKAQKLGLIDDMKEKLKKRFNK